MLRIKSLEEKMAISLCFQRHPMLLKSRKLREAYLKKLEYFILKYAPEDIFLTAILEQYKRIFQRKMTYSKDTSLFSLRCAFVIDCLFLCAFNDEKKGRVVLKELKTFITEAYHESLDTLYESLYHGKPLPFGVKVFSELIYCWRKNQEFLEKPVTKILVTANMSAGKSTLINALVGKKVARTSQEVCTGNNCFIYNKPYEDNQVALQTPELNLDAKEEELQKYDWQNSISMATNFRCSYKQTPRICLIDTPGVNSSMSRQHRKIAREALIQEKYDILLCILNANKLGTDEELEHIKWVSDNILKDKVIFVLNKLDDFRSEDNIQASIEGVKKDLNAIGYENPIVCPISAYFAYLLKKKEYGDILTEDEEDEYLLYSKKFGKQEYDLSPYYVAKSEEDMQIDPLYKSCGIYYLEKILYGGMV